MFDRFTDNARKVLGEARNVAYRHTCDSITTECILVGLFLTENTVAADSLRFLGVEKDQLALALGSGDAIQHRDSIPFCNSAKKALEAAYEESRSLRHSYIGTEHLLLGLLKNKNDAQTILQHLGLDLLEIERFVLNRIGVYPKPQVKVQCGLCDESNVLQLRTKCHLSAPLKVELVDQKTLILRCYVPDCSREVARFTIQE